MNKFAAIMLLAFVGVAAATLGDLPNEDLPLIDLQDPDVQLALTPSDADETAGLVGEQTIFSDFCIKSRDYVMGDIKSQTNQLTATIFQMFFKNAEEIGQAGLDAGKAVADEQTAAMKAADAPIVAPKTLYQSVVQTIGAAATTVSKGVVNSLNGLMGSFGVDNVVNSIKNVCDQFAHYEQQNRVAFAEFAKTIADKDAALAATPYEKVACLTARRISRLESICKLASVAQGPVQALLGSFGKN